jgi:hypothetical protein
MPTFTVATVCDERLPRLAWGARVNFGDGSVVVRHGPWVETGAGMAVEGAWSADFCRGEFAEALTFTGTGLSLSPDGTLRLAAPSHTLQALFTLRRGDVLFCANSLAFLLTLSGTALDLSYRFYYEDLASIMDGLRKYVRRVPVADGYAEVHYHCNLVLQCDGHIRREAKRAPGRLRDFATYRAFLQDQLCRVVHNARDSRRRVTYEPLTTISSGYDSPACAVLAKATGCTRAVSFTKARQGFMDRHDSGSHIGERLGLYVTEVDPETYRERSDFPEAEFIATGMPGDDVFFAGTEALLCRTLLFTGYHGDKVWGRYTADVGPDIVRGDPSGGSLSEFRLRVGFLNLPAPFIGCVRHEDIHSISNSEEMTPWRVPGTDYDRPIPRRIVETAGVPRALFGQQKKAAAIPYQTLPTTPRPPIEAVLGPASMNDFRRATKDLPLFPTRIARAHFALLRLLYRAHMRVTRSGTLTRLCRRCGLAIPSAEWVPNRYARPRSEHALVFHWAFERVRSRYETGDRSP